LQRLDYNQKWEEFIAGKRAARCTICNYYFYYNQISPLPVNPDEDLLRSGRIRIDEEKKKLSG
jgi:hypothetical protein